MLVHLLSGPTVLPALKYLKTVEIPLCYWHTALNEAFFILADLNFHALSGCLHSSFLVVLAFFLLSLALKPNAEITTPLNSKALK